MSDSVEMRIRGLTVPTPPGLVDRAEAAASRVTYPEPTSRADRPSKGSLFVRLRLPSIAIVGALALNVAAVSLAPAYAQAVAQAPVLGLLSRPVLEATGLTEPGISPIDQSASASGHTIRILAASAEGDRNVVVYKVDDQPLEPPVPLPLFSTTAPRGWSRTQSYSLDATLTDQFGHTYHQTNAGPSSLAATFEPLAGPASQVGARLTLRIDHFSPNVAYPAWSINAPLVFHFTLVHQPTRSLPNPGVVTANGITYTIQSIRLSGRYLEVHWTVSGMTERQRESLPAGCPLSYPTPPAIPASRIPSEAQARDFAIFRCLLEPKLTRTDGMWAYQTMWGSDFVDAIVPSSGQYRLTFGSAMGQSEGATIRVP